MAIYQLGDLVPNIHEDAYISPEATIIGNVTIGAFSSVWPGVVIRGDNDAITIGRGTSIQEGTVLHIDEGCPLKIGDNVTIGHQVMLHGCTIEDGALIGIQAVVLNNAVIGKNCLVGAGAVVTEGKEFPAGSLIIGAPAKVARELSPENVARLESSAKHYIERASSFKKNLKKIG
jgi:carbonic anhydrase/acetyltransferase-like protein (isoleucine patch superfamily)